MNGRETALPDHLLVVEVPMEMAAERQTVGVGGQRLRRAPVVLPADVLLSDGPAKRPMLREEERLRGVQLRRLEEILEAGRVVAASIARVLRW
ncbi:MAG: hypothetical protein Q4G65_19175 [bacterium]|nr:hypothetical protein [bacterium]